MRTAWRSVRFNAGRLVVHCPEPARRISCRSHALVLRIICQTTSATAGLCSYSSTAPTSTATPFSLRYVVTREFEASRASLSKCNSATCKITGDSTLPTKGCAAYVSRRQRACMRRFCFKNYLICLRAEDDELRPVWGFLGCEPLTVEQYRQGVGGGGELVVVVLVLALRKRQRR